MKTEENIQDITPVIHKHWRVIWPSVLPLHSPPIFNIFHVSHKCQQMSAVGNAWVMWRASPFQNTFTHDWFSLDSLPLTTPLSPPSHHPFYSFPSHLTPPVSHGIAFTYFMVVCVIFATCWYTYQTNPAQYSELQVRFKVPCLALSGTELPSPSEFWCHVLMFRMCSIRTLTIISS